jgi:hypothetical protein
MRLRRRHGGTRQSDHMLESPSYVCAVGGATDLFRRRLDGLLYEVDEVWRAEPSQCLEGL